MISWSLPSLKTLRDLQVGALVGVVALGVYGLLRVGPYSIIGSVEWAPHAYNYVIWGAFGIILSYRWRVLVFPALFMLYGLDEVIWTGTYVITQCRYDALGIPYVQTTSFGFYVMVAAVAAVCFYIIRPGVKLRWYVLLPSAAWFLFYVFIVHMPIMGNECLPNVIPSNLGWEVAWQFSYIIPAYFTFYPRDEGTKTEGSLGFLRPSVG